MAAPRRLITSSIARRLCTKPALYSPSTFIQTSLCQYKRTTTCAAQHHYSSTAHTLSSSASPPSSPSTTSSASTTSFSSSSSSSQSTQDPKIYTYKDIQSLITNKPPKIILIDVREPSELSSTGRIPTSLNVPLTSSPDFAFLPSAEFEDKFSFARPGKEEEVIFYCKSGVRSKAAARLAVQGGFGGKVGEYPGSWKDWEGRGGEVER